MSFSKNKTLKYQVNENEVFEVLGQHILADGFDLVLDLEKSSGDVMFDKRTGKKYYDFFTGFASMPIGWNHPKLNNKEFIDFIGNIAINKPSNSDIYTEYMAEFVKTFFKVAVPDYFKYSFFVSGGALAVENAMKTAFDWKVRQNFRKGIKEEKGMQIIHFKEAFHGRTGYTLSLTNTDPVKTKYFPKFDWPRISNPKIKFPLNEENLADVIKREKLAIEEIQQAFKDNKDDIAAILIEPIQGEGGDNHFRKEFHQALRQICDKNEALFIYDEVQTGIALTGKMWAHQNYDVKPDILCFGKKMQVCGILVGDRIDNEPENVFKTSSRINSTWGGNLVDMVRAAKYLEIIEEENLLDNVNKMGKIIIDKLNNWQEKYPKMLYNARGQGMFASFDFFDVEKRNTFQKSCWEEGLVILSCGTNAMRFRPPLNLTSETLNAGFEIIEKVLKEMN